MLNDFSKRIQEKFCSTYWGDIDVAIDIDEALNI